MARTLNVAAVQAMPLAIGTPLDVFEADVSRVLASSPGTELLVYPELHLFGPESEKPADRDDALRASAAPLDGPFTRELGAIAARAGVWLLPGSVCERGENGELFNTALVFSPAGELVASYRKIFPWRPFEPYDPGDRFVVFEIPNVGTFGLSICYDAWFPEVTRHLAWMGAEVILNIVKTTTPDRAQELVLARANSIVNQTATLSLNCAGPIGEGKSLLVDAEGRVTGELATADPGILTGLIDLDAVALVRANGTAGFNRMWDQFQPSDNILQLPLYAGRIDPARWNIPTPPHPRQD